MNRDHDSPFAVVIRSTSTTSRRSTTSRGHLYGDSMLRNLVAKLLADNVRAKPTW